MRTIIIEYPETIPATLNLSYENFESEAKLAMAVKLYELSRLSSGQAAKMAGVSRVFFLMNCHRYGADSINWDDEEIALEFGEEPL